LKLGSSVEIAEGVHQIWAVGARVTVIAEGDDVVLVDTGSRGSLGPIISGLDSLGIAPERVGLIVLTHYHPDHSGGLSGLAPATSAKIAAHRSEADVLSGVASAPSPFRNGLVGKIAGPVINRFYGDAVEIDLLLEDGDRLPGPIDIDVIHTPGHTPGSICLGASGSDSSQITVTSVPVTVAIPSVTGWGMLLLGSILTILIMFRLRKSGRPQTRH
jgi:glyoxylase-like metal-dependent hydrolase (beta-lactamase superfamily II)